MVAIKNKIFLSGVLLGISILGFSQPYQSIFTADTCQWNVYEIIPDFGRNIQYIVDSDTTLNAKNYFILQQGELDNPGGTVDFIEDRGYILEDTVNGKYWWLDQEQEFSETLFMDLNLEKGDKFYFIWNYEAHLGDSILVDTVYYDSGRKIIEFDFMLQAMKLKFIEGIGPNVGFWISEYNSFDYYMLLCKFDNDAVVYSTEANEEGDCYKDPVGIKVINSLNEISIYPNPARDYFNVQLNKLPFRDFRLYVINSNGTCILNQKLSDSNTRLELTQKGLYIIVISDGNQVYSKRIINR